jgi:hypothetical protein
MLKLATDADFNGRVYKALLRQVPDFAWERVKAGLPMPGVFVIQNRRHHIGQMVNDILLVALCSAQDEWKDRVEFLPL